MERRLQNPVPLWKTVWQFLAEKLMTNASGLGLICFMNLIVVAKKKRRTSDSNGIGVGNHQHCVFPGSFWSEARGLDQITF